MQSMCGLEELQLNFIDSGYWKFVWLFFDDPENVRP